MNDHICIRSTRLYGLFYDFCLPPQIHTAMVYFIFFCHQYFLLLFNFCLYFFVYAFFVCIILYNLLTHILLFSSSSSALCLVDYEAACKGRQWRSSTRRKRTKRSPCSGMRILQPIHFLFLCVLTFCASYIHTSILTSARTRAIIAANLSIATFFS